MAPKWTDELNLKFVELYKEQRCLWDRQDELYKDKKARGTALDAIADKLNIEGFGAAEVKTKIKSFRGTFNIEYGKQTKSAQSGCGTADVYVPSLKWFGVMKEVMAKGTLTSRNKGSWVSRHTHNKCVFYLRYKIQFMLNPFQLFIQYICECSVEMRR